MWMQNQQDLHDAWKLLERNKSLTLWCFGQDSHKKKRSEADLGSEQDDTSNSDDEATEKRHQVERILAPQAKRKQPKYRH